jgi:monooxygenase
MGSTHVDVLVVGAGVSGIGVACHLAAKRPETSLLVLERRQAIGGTWDLFRYPGIRCDSDMNTFGYSFRPWQRDDIVIDGSSIRDYVRETAEAYGVDRHIRFGRRVVAAAWSTPDARWTVEAINEDTGEHETFTASFVVGCTGYYDYDQPHQPDFAGMDQFAGTLVHPQFWPEDLDHAGKHVVVIGSGATAVTLVPALAETAEHVTMLQRSPTYIVSVPALDPVGPLLRRVLPGEVVSHLTRMRNLGIQLGMYQLCRRFPGVARQLILAGVRKQLDDDGQLRHFRPRYDPWDERLCIVPDGDFFAALRSGQASVVTDHIDTFTKTGVRTRSGQDLNADIIVTATGFQLKVLGNVEATVDGVRIDPTRLLTYKGIMIGDVPNFAFVFGYVNVSWTRKVDLVGEWLCRILGALDRSGMRQITPRPTADVVSDEPFMPLTSGYVTRSADLLPRQGTRAPWRNTDNVLRDWLLLRLRPIEDEELEFSNPEPRAAAGSAPLAVPA